MFAHAQQRPLLTADIARMQAAAASAAELQACWRTVHAARPFL
jgi:hypothetical protein